MKKTIRIGGVPEHFNVLWHYALEKGYFDEAGIDLQWIDYPSGSAPLARDMDAGVIDLSVILTESIIASIANGNHSKIVSVYVDSPLVWGIHVASNSDITGTDQMPGKKYAVSRLGSGSHLMALVDAEKRGFLIHRDQFVVVNNLQGAVDGLPGKADLFFWEKFTTKPWVDKGIFRRIGECPTPWPCFVIAGGTDFLQQNKDVVITLVSVIKKTALEFRTLTNATDIIAKRYQQKTVDVDEWYSNVSWAKNTHVNKNDMEKVISKLLQLGVIEKLVEVDELLM